MHQETTERIKEAPGAHAIFLAARHDERLSGRLTRRTGGKLYLDGERLGKTELASVLVYLTGRYGLTPSEFELWSGLLAAAEDEAVERAEVPVDGELVEVLETRLRRRHIGATTRKLLDDVRLGVGAFFGADVTHRGIEMSLGSALRHLGWERRRSMIRGVRAHRWYPPAGWTPAVALPAQELPLDAAAVEAAIDGRDTVETVDEVPEDMGPDPWGDLVDSDIVDHSPVESLILEDEDDAMPDLVLLEGEGGEE